jgi:hypothetical protein
MQSKLTCGGFAPHSRKLHASEDVDVAVFAWPLFIYLVIDAIRQYSI